MKAKECENQFMYAGRTIYQSDHPEVETERREYTDHTVDFRGFLDMPILSDGMVEIHLKKTVQGDASRNWLPMYIYSIVNEEGKEVGEISLRIGYNEEVYYGGNIGFAVEEPYWGRGYAPRACRLIFQLARAHKMPMLAISNEYHNTKSMRVCEKLGMRYMRTVELPSDNEMRVRNPQHMHENIYFIEL